MPSPVSPRLAVSGLPPTHSSLATAQTQSQTIRLRGTIESVDGSTLLFKPRSGPDVKVMLTPDASVLAIVKASLAEVKEGSFVGVAGTPQPDGSQRAIEVHIFPESMRGTGEGHREWDLQPASTMTNANVVQTVKSVDGQTLTMKYKGGEKKVVVPPNAPIVAYAPGDKTDLEAGVKIIVNAATKEPDGSLKAARINYGKDGQPRRCDASSARLDTLSNSGNSSSVMEIRCLQTDEHR